MSRCLRDEELWLCHEGGGRDAQRAHVAECAKCSARLRQLGEDLRVLSQVLREAPPDPAPARSRSLLSWRWIPVAAACAATFFFLWPELPTKEPSSYRTTTSSVAREKAIIDILEHDVYTALFTDEDLGVVDAPARVSTLAYVQAALDGGWPCERAGFRKQKVCEQRPIFLTIENR